ncbi:lycopene cyclase domain-containing protein [Oxyplasma meridianum]|uniref:Lycopene cyclase domain-containing protein n=1 Tax=Oxyplasma meridianum TaxID=3073602 RepID=A0AAX4NEC7_9ARCH
MEITLSVAGHFAYLLLLALIALPVLGLSISSKIRKIRKFKPLVFSIFTVAPIYIVWDEYAVLIGTWKFNHSYIIGLYLWLIPVEEILFFIIVPFATLLIYEGLFMLKGVSSKVFQWPGIAAGLILVGFGIVNWQHSYTIFAFIFAGMALIFMATLEPQMLFSSRLWAFMAISYIPFVVFDHIMVTLPIFTYGKNVTLGIYIFSIPLEEYVYVFSLLLFYVLAYNFYQERHLKPISKERTSVS